MILNGTITANSSAYKENFIMFAGYLLIVFYYLIFILGLVGNSMVIYVAIRKKKYRNVTNCYVINLAVADLLFLTVAIPYTTYLGLVKDYTFGETICKIYMYLAYVFLLATCNTLAAMSIDRCFYIVLPAAKLQSRTPQTALIVCILIWASSLALIVPYHIISHRTTSNLSCGSNNHSSFLVCFVIFSSYYALPLFIIIVCYTKLAMHVMQSSRLTASQTKNKMIPKRLKTKPQQVTRTVIIVTLAFAICWLPIHVLELMKCANSSMLDSLIRSYPKLLYAVRALTHALAYFNSCLNPYLYALLNRNFCCDLIDIIPTCLKPRSQTSTIQTKHSNVKDKYFRSTLIPNRSLLKQQTTNDDNTDDEHNYREKLKKDTADVGCQIELIAMHKK
ncbi:unnamed protein product [Rotaria socialis]|uniref:G-protein coupled receptors family 1 profile domain-containing protein n=1 Tax=Rotaria socialis TaxID=392032 RepID=A0A818EIB9_9BILA|nr:unnamed protein product [Rotaria socialis]